MAFGDRLTGFTRSSADVWGGITAGLGAVGLAAGAYSLAQPWAGEIAARDYRAALGTGMDYARAFAVLEDRFRELSAREERRRWIGRGVGALVMLGSAAAIVYTEVTATTPDERLDGRIYGGTGILFGGTFIAASYLLESPIQRLVTVWEREPGLHLEPTVVPTVGGATFGVVVRF
jgi:hypothetical protein